MPGYLLEKTGKWEKEGSRNLSIYHKLNGFHKTDNPMGAAYPQRSLQLLSSNSHLQAGSGLQAQR